MSIEFLLRRRAARARWLAALLLLLTTSLLVCAYLSLPKLATDLLMGVNKIDGPPPKADITGKDSVQDPRKALISTHVFTLATMGLGVVTIGFACYLLSRSALLEGENAARLNALADALCVGANDQITFEKAASILVPKTGLGDPATFSANDLKIMAEMLKQLKELK